MSWSQAAEAECTEEGRPEPVEIVIEPRVRDIGEMDVRRVLPSRQRRMVGPYVFFDEMGPATFPPGESLAVRPHPHINLATVTYLFEGEVLHRDSTGAVQAIRPGAVNWMTAGRGITHSERARDEVRETGGPLHGLQIWIALPEEHEEAEPAFHHHPAETLPKTRVGDAEVRVMIGEAYGLASPVATFSPMLYVDVDLPAGARLKVPEGVPELAAYLVSGAMRCAGQEYAPHRMLVFRPGATPELEAVSDARLALLGGAPLPGGRHIWWNFVSSRKERIEQAKADWKEGRFPEVPGDAEEFIPLPES
jgi:redox-sensitive bicupin YhaK (pirin superfamily)